MKRNDILNIAIVFLALLIFNSFPFSFFIKNPYIYTSLSILLKALFFIFLIFYTKHEFNLKFLLSKPKIEWLLVIPFLLATFSNLIVISIDGCETVDIEIWLFVLKILSTALSVILEEFVFRYILLTYLNKNKSIVSSILLSSLLFGAAHLVNINSVASILPTLLQCAYTFGLGILLAISYAITTNFIVPFVIHFAFNVINNLVATNYYTLNWTATFFIVNGIIAAILIVYVLVLYFLNKKYNNRFVNNYIVLI